MPAGSKESMIEDCLASDLTLAQPYLGITTLINRASSSASGLVVELVAEDLEAALADFLPVGLSLVNWGNGL